MSAYSPPSTRSNSTGPPPGFGQLPLYHYPFDTQMPHYQTLPYQQGLLVPPPGFLSGRFAFYQEQQKAFQEYHQQMQPYHSQSQYQYPALNFQNDNNDSDGHQENTFSRQQASLSTPSTSQMVRHQPTHSVRFDTPSSQNSENSQLTQQSELPENELYSEIVPGNGNSTDNQLVCQHQNVLLFSVPLPIGNHIFHYDPVQKKLVEHKCRSCVYQTQEKDIIPLYSVPIPNTQDIVIFAKNVLTKNTEQYIYSYSYGGFEQVQIPNLEFDSNIYSSPLISASSGNDKKSIVILKDGQNKPWKKVCYEGGVKTEITDPTPIRTLMVKEVEEMERNGLLKKFMNPHPEFKISHCIHLKKDFIQFESEGAKFGYNNDTREFESIHCGICEDRIQEKHLFPKYAEFSEKAGGYIIHTWNSENKKMEQYMLNTSTFGFYQVQYPEVRYWARKNTKATVICVIKTGKKGEDILIERGFDGRIVKMKSTHRGAKPFKLEAQSVKTLKKNWNRNE